MKSNLKQPWPLAGLFAFLAISGCSQQQSPGNLNSASSQSGANSQPSLVKSSQVSVIDSRKPSVAPGADSSNSVQVSMVVDRDAILKQEFLYGADLQYSSLFDTSMSLYNQSLAIGHIPARFRIAGNELQLVADNKRLYPSDVNHPEQLLSRYKILAQTDAQGGTPATLTISGANSGIILSQLFSGATAGTSNGALANPGVKAPQDLWIRSFDYVPNGNYLLQQTSVTLADGTIAEFMESVFPRVTLTPGAKFQKFQMDPDDSVGATTGPAYRFRMLNGEKIFEGDKAVSYAQHFDLSPNPDGSDRTIDFYVTPNIPDEDLAPVKLAVEGWNRYFTTYKDIQRKVLQFKGRLPDGIHIGDPRFNVINSG